jgi:hypothetical protein
LLLLASGRAVAQPTLSWSPDFAINGPPTAPADSIIFDDGTGLSLYVSGFMARAGGRLCNGIARFDGEHWQPLGRGPLSSAGGSGTGLVRDMAVLDIDGPGPIQPMLYVAGQFRPQQSDGTILTGCRLARWTGTQWERISEYASGGQGYALLPVEGPEGPRLYVGSARGGSLSYFGASGRVTIPFVDTVYPNAILALEFHDPDGAGPLEGKIFVSGASDVLVPGVIAVSLDGAIESLPPQPPDDFNFT